MCVSQPASLGRSRPCWGGTGTSTRSSSAVPWETTRMPCARPPTRRPPSPRSRAATASTATRNTTGRAATTQTSPPTNQTAPSPDNICPPSPALITPWQPGNPSEDAVRTGSPRLRRNLSQQHGPLAELSSTPELLLVCSWQLNCFTRTKMHSDNHSLVPVLPDQQLHKTPSVTL